MKVWCATCLLFGGVHVSTVNPMNLRFPGQWFQSESGLHQNWMRDEACPRASPVTPFAGYGEVRLCAKASIWGALESISS